MSRANFGHAAGGLSKDTVDADALLAFSDATGGKTFILVGPHQTKGVDQVDRAAQEVAAELAVSTRWLLSEEGSDGWRLQPRVQVEVNKPNLKVHRHDAYLLRQRPPTLFAREACRFLGRCCQFK